MLFCHFNNCHVSRSHPKNPLCLVIHRSYSSVIRVLFWDCNYSVTSSGSIPILVLLLYPSHLQLLPPLKFWIPQSHPWGLESSASKLLWMLVFWSIPLILWMVFLSLKLKADVTPILMLYFLRSQGGRHLDVFWFNNIEMCSFFVKFQRTFFPTFTVSYHFILNSVYIYSEASS